MTFTFICIIVIKYFLSTVTNPNIWCQLFWDRLIQMDLSFQGGGRDRLGLSKAIINMDMIRLSSILFLLFSALPVFTLKCSLPLLLGNIVKFQYYSALV